MAISLDRFSEAEICRTSQIGERPLITGMKARVVPRGVQIHKRVDSRIRAGRFAPMAIALDRFSDAEIRGTSRIGDRPLITGTEGRIVSPRSEPDLS